MGNSNRKNVATGRKDKLCESDVGSSAEESVWTAPRPPDSVVLLESRRKAAKTQAAPAFAAAGAGKPPKEIGEQIGKELRGLFADIVAQPVPDRFLDLLNQLEAKTISGGTSSKAPGER